MMLHEDRYAFLALLNQIHKASGIRFDILEKDYYVSLLLRELAEKQKDLPAYFKGGTALYKALKSIRRFSEDIDLTVSIENCSNSQAKRRLEQASKKYTSLPRTTDKAMEEDRRGSITTVYDYEPAVPVDEVDPLQRFRHVKIEATSFTVSEPFSPMEVEPIIYTFASEEQRQILRDRYGLAPFALLTIRLERIFADKILAAEFYYDRKMYFDVAKHIYDVSIMVDLPEIQCLIDDPEELHRMIGYKKLEETRRIGSDLDTRPFSEYRIFDGIANNKAFATDFQRMQNNYVFNREDILSMDYVLGQWSKLKRKLLKLSPSAD
ncbi:MAG: nucleotidyl transferase AbiEii/AbiGii toxin family protein [Lachnospiraceae bacterium]|nr:nucleotidyl transferase AbiEii/AbiGii toxin family protein [Lachnospiraceae bacterium]